MTLQNVSTLACATPKCDVAAKPSVAGTYSTRGNAMTAARSTLGLVAKLAVDYDVVAVPNPVDPEKPRWRFEPIIREPSPAQPAVDEPVLKQYPKKVQAQYAAVATLGSEARNGFEFEVRNIGTKNHPKWIWEPTTGEPKPMTELEARVSGRPWPKGQKTGPAVHPPVGSNGADDAPQAINGGDGPVSPIPALTSPADGLDPPAFLQRTRTPETDAAAAKIVAAEKARREGKGLKNPPSAKTTKKRKAKREAGGKTALVASMLKSKNGCTNKEVLKATGWPTVSMPQMAKAAGLKLVKEKKPGEPTRYFGS